MRKGIKDANESEKEIVALLEKWKILDYVKESEPNFWGKKTYKRSILIEKENNHYDFYEIKVTLKK